VAGRRGLLASPKRLAPREHDVYTVCTAMAPDRDHQFRMNLSQEEKLMLTTLAEAEGLSASDYLRTLIRKQHAQATRDEKLTINVVNRFKAAKKTKPKRK
jgi:hypothetical protein